MDKTQIFKLLGFFIIVFGLIILTYEDIPVFYFIKHIRCKLGLHKRVLKFGDIKIRKYYCQWCKQSRKHPKLEAIEGGKKDLDIYFKF